MPSYPVLAITAAVAVVSFELVIARTGLFRDPTYWITLLICFGFMVAVDGRLTKLSAPIVIYRPADVSGIRPLWDILVEEYAYAFALLTGAMLSWDLAGRRFERMDQ